MPDPLCEVVDYYDQYAEESRLQQGPFQLERERTLDIFSRFLPPPPARVVDVGGAAGTYSAWLAARGYEARLLDLSPRLVAEARRVNATLATRMAAIEVGDARALPYADASADAVLMMGPLYHLPSAADRATALREARRVLVPGGVVAVAAISRFASALDGLVRGWPWIPRSCACAIGIWWMASTATRPTGPTTSRRRTSTGPRSCAAS